MWKMYLACTRRISAKTFERFWSGLSKYADIFSECGRIFCTVMLSPMQKVLENSDQHSIVESDSKLAEKSRSIVPKVRVGISVWPTLHIRDFTVSCTLLSQHQTAFYLHPRVYCRGAITT